MCSDKGERKGEGTWPSLSISREKKGKRKGKKGSSKCFEPSGQRKKKPQRNEPLLRTKSKGKGEKGRKRLRRKGKKGSNGERGNGRPDHGKKGGKKKKGWELFVSKRGRGGGKGRGSRLEQPSPKGGNGRGHAAAERRKRRRKRAALRYSPTKEGRGGGGEDGREVLRISTIPQKRGEGRR